MFQIIQYLVKNKTFWCRDRLAQRESVGFVNFFSKGHSFETCCTPFIFSSAIYFAIILDPKSRKVGALKSWNLWRKKNCCLSVLLSERVHSPNKLALWLGVIYPTRQFYYNNPATYTLSAARLKQGWRDCDECNRPS